MTKLETTDVVPSCPATSTPRPDHRVVVLVHPGSLYTSARAQVEPGVLDRVQTAIREEIRAARSLVVIDGFLSDGLPFDVNEEILTVLRAAMAEQNPAFRLWGCDAGETPGAGWQAFGEGLPLVSHGQQEAAERVWPYLSHATEISVTGAWATHDNSSGCVNSVADVLRKRLPGCRVTVSETALYEDQILSDDETDGDETDDDETDDGRPEAEEKTGPARTA